MNLPEMPRTVKERTKIPALYEASSIQKIRLSLKLFTYMRSIAGDERDNSENAGDIKSAEAALKEAELHYGSTMAVFERTGQGKMIYSH
jgi:hypothetical protein